MGDCWISTAPAHQRRFVKRLRGKLTYANVVSTLCLFLVLGGGAAFAATHLPKNSVGAKQLKKGAVTPKKLSAASKRALAGRRGPAGEKGETGAAGPSTTVFAGFHDGDIKLTSALSPMLSISVPAGSYAVQAKAVGVALSGDTDLVFCQLVAGGDSDDSQVALGEIEGGATEASIAMQVVHKFASASTVSVVCQREGPGSSLAIRDIKITAIQVGSIAANTPG